ncbi:MAG: hypothetical protein ACREQY_04550 [Candidatus Binatia bacterium]
MNRIFILSPAQCTGRRAAILLSARAAFPLARRLRSEEGAPLGEVFAFLSGLYFRGKLAYARAFARPPAGLSGALVITPSRGLRPAEEPITAACLREFATVAIDATEARYREPLARDAGRLFATAGTDCEIVLLGSVATPKYVDLLHERFGERARFPAEFVGRGDMSRGGLMLRCVDEGRELEYLSLDGTMRRGPRPPKLAPRRPVVTGEVQQPPGGKP